MRQAAGSAQPGSWLSSALQRLPPTSGLQRPVVLCAGNALNTPCLLLRSGIHCNGQVGNHLQCHPIAFAVGTCPQVSSPACPFLRHHTGPRPQLNHVHAVALLSPAVWKATPLALQGRRGKAAYRDLQQQSFEMSSCGSPLNIIRSILPADWLMPA